MKRFLYSLLILVSIFSVAFASSVSFDGLSDADVVLIAQMAQNELFSRGFIKTAKVPQGVYIIGVDIPSGTYTVSQNEYLASVEVFSSATSMNDIYDYTIREDETIGRLVLENGQRLEVLHSSINLTVYSGISFQ